MTDTSATALPQPLPDAEAEVVELVSDLIRIDSSNYGDGTGPGEAQAAEYVEARLREVGLDPERFECAPRREGVVVRIPGRDRSRGAFIEGSGGAVLTFRPLSTSRRALAHSPARLAKRPVELA